MKTKSWCKQCYSEYESKRADSEFCSGKCCAKWYRDNTTSEAAFHAARDRFYVYNCQFCDAEFWINDYGKRGGQREPKFCSTKCRVASHRAVHAAMGHQEGWKDANTNRQRPPKGDKKAQDDHRKQQEQNKRDKEQAEREQRQREQDRQQQQDRQRQRQRQQQQSTKSWWDVLGVSGSASFDECKKAYRALVKKFHPDVCKDADATEKMQAINEAYELAQIKWGKK